jgi:hypothetical protein
MTTTEELLGRKSSGSCLENREYGLGILCADHATPSVRKVGTNSLTSDVRFVGLVLSQTKATEFSLVTIFECIRSGAKVR